MSLKLQFGPRIRSDRKAEGLTQSEISRQTGLDEAYISRLENGSAEGSPSQIAAIARTIGVPVAQLYDEQDETVKKVADLSDEAIELARAWQALPPEQRIAMKVDVEALRKQIQGED